jgi:hypothetical protein
MDKRLTNGEIGRIIGVRIEIDQDKRGFVDILGCLPWRSCRVVGRAAGRGNAGRLAEFRAEWGNPPLGRTARQAPHFASSDLCGQVYDASRRRGKDFLVTS